MIITYFGKEFFKIQVGDTVIALNPISKNSELKTTRFGADIGIVSLNHKDFNGVENLKNGGKNPVVISGPGEYEIKGVFIKGYSTEVFYEGEKKINTVYTILFENIQICFLGSLGKSSALTSEIKGKLRGVEILFTPIGGGDVLEPSDAYNKVAVTLEPNVIIPMDYEGDNKKELIDAFLKEGVGELEELDKLTIKKKDLMSRNGSIVVLKSQ